MFGFGPTKDGAWHHYFEDWSTDSNGGPHDGGFEGTLLSELHNTHRITVYKGW